MKDYFSESFISQRRKELFDERGNEIPVSAEALEKAARNELDSDTYNFIAGGAGTGDTVRSNRTGFAQWKILPRVLRDVTHRDLSIDLKGQRLSAPFFTAPIPLSLPHDNGELATARATSTLGIPITLSSGAAVSIEELSQKVPDGIRWYQLYWSTEWDLTASMVQRAEAAGYEAIMLTVDAPIPRWKPKDLQNTYSPLGRFDPRPNYFDDPVFKDLLGCEPSKNLVEAHELLKSIILNSELTWEDLETLREHTSLPLIVKGILHPEDAVNALEAKVDGIIVTNHGGRQVDGSIGAIDALGQITELIDGEIPVLFDSGIRTGADAFKAIALGADAVSIGRPLLYGLALAGQDGAAEVLQNIIAEFDSVMGLSGYTSVTDIDRSALTHTA